MKAKKLLALLRSGLKSRYEKPFSFDEAESKKPNAEPTHHGDAVPAFFAMAPCSEPPTLGGKLVMKRTVARK